MPSIQTTCGSTFYYSKEPIGEGAAKIVYMTTDKKHVVCFYKKSDPADRSRVQQIIGNYRMNVLGGNGAFFKDLMCWPTHMFDNELGFGIICPTYPENFFFSIGSNQNAPMSLKGKEKHGRWFTGVYQRAFLHKKELSDWSSYIRICLQLARSVRKLHAAGLAHSDLSYNNVLFDPFNRTACIIDIDALVVPGLYPPQVLGTPGFIAPEVLRTQRLKMSDPNKFLPRRETDLHALAILIYSLLLYRHPLAGPKVHDADDPNRDENLMMGARALFIEHPTDRSNRPTKRWLDKKWKHRRLKNNTPLEYLPWTNPDSVPYTSLGPYLSPLVKAAFVDGLHHPKKRPSANLWEQALVRTADNILPCSNPDCAQKWFIYNNETSPVCSFCKTPYQESLPIVDFYYQRRGTQYVPANHRMVARNGTRIYKWHTNEYTPTGENLSNEDRKPMGVIFKKDGKWLFLNQELETLKLVKEKRIIEKGKMFELTEGMQLLFDNESGGRLGLLRFAK